MFFLTTIWYITDVITNSDLNQPIRTPASLEFKRSERKRQSPRRTTLRFRISVSRNLQPFRYVFSVSLSALTMDISSSMPRCINAMTSLDTGPWLKNLLLLAASTPSKSRSSVYSASKISLRVMPQASSTTRWSFSSFGFSLVKISQDSAERPNEAQYS